jgi:hypothetical protein
MPFLINSSPRCGGKIEVSGFIWQRCQSRPLWQQAKDGSQDKKHPVDKAR